MSNSFALYIFFDLLSGSSFEAIFVPFSFHLISIKFLFGFLLSSFSDL